MKARFRRFLPDPDRIQSNRWLRWLGPRLMHPRLWHFSRRGVAVGVSLGVFFGLLIPIAQIPFAAGAAVLMRANVPAAVASTLVTNPVTFAPVYLAAHRLGSALLGEPPPRADAVPTAPVTPPADASPVEPGWWRSLWRGILSLGKPLLLGLSILAICAGLLTYGVIMLAWRIRTVWQWKRRRQRP